MSFAAPSDASSTVPWERMQRAFLMSHRPLQVYVAYNADAAAALCILTSMFKSSLIQFHIQPIFSEEELRAAVTTLRDEEGESELFVLIGIGSSVVLRDIFDAALHTVIVLDNTRPVQIQNLLDEGAVVGERTEPWLVHWQWAAVVEDADEMFRKINHAREQKRRRQQRAKEESRRQRRTRRLADERGRKTRSSTAAGDEEEGSQDDPVDEDDGRDDLESNDDSRASSVDSDDHSVDSADLDDDEEDNVPSSQQADWRNPELLDEGAIEAYLCMRFSGPSMAVTVCEASMVLNRDRDLFLWCAGVGVTDLLLRQEVDYATYLLAMSRIRDHVALQQHASAAAPQAATSSSLKLHLADEPQLFLLRHTSLWTAVWFSRTEAALLRLHHEASGTQTLSGLLARCGVSTRMAQQSWMEIPGEDRNRALELVCSELAKLELMPVSSRHAAAVDLAALDAHARGGLATATDDTDSLFSDNPKGGAASVSPFALRNSELVTIPCIKAPNKIPAVCRTQGFSGVVSTFDACHLFRALLCSSVPSAGAGDSRQVLEASLKESMRHSFWRAYDLLVTCNPNTAEFLSAVHEARSLQASVALATSALLQRGVVLSSRRVHYMLPHDASSRVATVDSFWPPLRLQYLAEHVALSLTIERGRRWPMHPVILVCPFPRNINNDPQQQSDQLARGSSDADVTYTVAMADEGASSGIRRWVPSMFAWRSVTRSHHNKSAVVAVDPLHPTVARVEGKDAALHLVEASIIAMTTQTSQGPNALVRHMLTSSAFDKVTDVSTTVFTAAESTTPDE